MESFGVDEAKMGTFDVHSANNGTNLYWNVKIFVQNVCQARGNFAFRSNFAETSNLSSSFSKGGSMVIQCRLQKRGSG